MNENSFDENNLLYVRKTYEIEVTEKARKIFADNTVQTTLDETNKQLDELISEMNTKLGFITNKIVGSNGVEEYVKDVHNQIDNTVVDSTELVDSSIVNTESHPSIVAFKNNRSETKYKTYDFINKTIDIGFKDKSLRFYNNTDINDDDNVHSFEINMDDVEKIKIIEFSFTYSQNPNLVKIVDDVVYKEPTTQINRVFNGRFFIIRHDPINYPEEIIVKAIVENADNSGNIVDEYALDIKKSNIEDVVSLKNELGPTFDIYFRIVSTNKLMISIGNINPYKYLLKKNYIESNKAIKDSFNLVKSGISSISLDKIFYSNNMKKIFIVDEKVNKIYITSSIDRYTIDKISFDNSSVYDKLSTNKFFVKDVGSFTFVGDDIKCLVYTKDNSDYVDLGVYVEDVQIMSTNEIVVQVGSEINGRKISNLYLFNYSTTQLNPTVFAEFHTETTNINFIQQNKFIEYEPGKIILVSNSKSGCIYYKFLRINTSTNTYTANATESATVEQKVEFDELMNYNVKDDGSELNIYVYETGLYIHLNCESVDNNKKTFIISLNDLTINALRYIFNKKNLLKSFNYTTSEVSPLNVYVKKIYITSLFIFGITDDNHLVVIDDKYVVKALNFTPVIKDGNIIGYNDKNSMFYMKPEDNEKEYYLIDNPYLQNIKNIYQSYKGNIYILDAKGVYELTASKNLVCKFWSDEDVFTNTLLNRDIDTYIVSKTSDNKFNIFYQEFTNDESSSKKLRHKYFDLVNGNYIKFDEDADYSDYDFKDNDIIIDFKAKLYCTLVDKLSVIYNGKDINNIVYSNSKYVFNDINPAKEHIVPVRINDESINKIVPITKFSLSTNKYGFINYHGFTILNTTNVSDINNENLYVLIHKNGDNLSIADYRESIYRLIKEQTSKELDNIDENDEVKPGHEISITVKKNYKHVNKNRIVNTRLRYHDGTNYDIFGSLLSNKNNYIIGNQIYDKINRSTFSIELPKAFYNSVFDPLHFGLKKDPFDIVSKHENYLIGFDSDNINTLVVMKETFNDDYEYVVVKEIPNVVCARNINNELYYSKNNNGLYKIDFDNEYNEIEIVSNRTGYIFYDFMKIKEGLYAISNRGLLVKIDETNPNATPDTIISELPAIGYNNGSIVANFYKFESTDKLIIRLAHNTNKCDYYTPFIYVLPDVDDLSKYITIQKPFSNKAILDYTNETLITNLKLFIEQVPEFVFDFIEVNDSIFACGSSVFKFDINTYDFESMLFMGHYEFYGKHFVSNEYNNSNYDPKGLFLIKSPYGKGYICSIDEEENFKIIIDDCKKPILFDKEDERYNPLISYLSNNKISNERYKIEIDDVGRIFINDEPVMSNGVYFGSNFNVAEYNPVKFTSQVKMVKNYNNEFVMCDVLSSQPIYVYRLAHEKCRWNSVKFNSTTTVASLLEKGIKVYKYVEDTDLNQVNQYVKVDINKIKYPIPGVQYYTKTTISNQDRYTPVSNNIKKWDVNALGLVEYYEIKHHYELLKSNVTINANDYVFFCENLYFDLLTLDVDVNSGDIISLPTGDEYYTLNTNQSQVRIETRIDERSAFVLNDDKILMRAKVNDIPKTLIYDTFNNNDFTNHATWEINQYPKAGFEIRRIWEFSDKKFAVIKLPCFDYCTLCLISDDLQQIQCQLDQKPIYEPECVHIVENENEILISIAYTNYSNVDCYVYKSTNEFEPINESKIYVDSVIIDNKTYLLGLINNYANNNSDTRFEVFITDKNKEPLLSLTNGIAIPLYSTNRNSVKQFDKVFIKRYNNEKKKDEAYIFFKVNTSTPNSENTEDVLFDCIHIIGNTVELKDFNLLTYSKSDVNGSAFRNVILSPDNKILIVCENSVIFSIDELENLEVISKEKYTETVDPYSESEESGDYPAIADGTTTDPEQQLYETITFNDSNRLYYAKSYNNVYLIDEHVNTNLSIHQFNYRSRKWNNDLIFKYIYDYYLASIDGSDVVNNNGNPFDVFDTRLKYYFNGDIQLNPIDSKYFIPLPRQKILPVRYKDTMIFGTSVMDEATGKPSSNWFTLYDETKVNLIENYVCFDYLFVTKSGKMFGVYKSNIYENDDVLSSNKWFRVVGSSVKETDFSDSGYVVNSFRKMIETNYGIFYFDSKNILRYNEEADKFEAVENTFFNNANNTLNFAEKFDSGLFIGNKRDHKFELVKEALDVNTQDYIPGVNLNYYDPTQKKFVSLIPDSVCNTITGMNDSRIVSIRDTSKGVFVLYCSESNFKNTIFRCYLSVNNIMSWEECKYKTTFTIKNPIGNFTANQVFNNQYPTNLKQIWEDEETNTIWITGSVHQNRDKSNTNIGSNISNVCCAWAYTQFVENDNGDYRHKHGNNYRFEPNIDRNGDPYLRNTNNNLYQNHAGDEDIIETKNFGKFTTLSTIYKGFENTNNYTEDVKYDYIIPCKVICSGNNDNVLPTSNFEYQKLTNIYIGGDLNANQIIIKELNNNLYMIIHESFNKVDSIYDYFNSKIIVLRYDVDNNEWISVSDIDNTLNHTMKGFRFEDIDIEEYNGIIYLKDSYNHDIYILDNYEFDGIESMPEIESNDVLYEIRAIFDNQDSYNNLIEKTDNTNLDKFVLKEIGIIDGITGETKHIFQYFEPNEFYNGSDGTVKPLVESPREFNQSNTIKQLYKNIYQKFSIKNLINNRFIKPGQKIIADGFKHEVHQILGDVEDYLVNTDNVRIELKIYPTEVNDMINDIIQPSKFGIETVEIEAADGIEPFDPYD